MLPQFPFTEQQGPNELPAQVAPVVDAEPHFPSKLTGVEVGDVLVGLVDVGMVDVVLTVDDEVEEPVAEELQVPYRGWL